MNVNVPEAPAVPESTPVVGEIVMPAGGVPDEMLHVTGAPAPV